MLLLRRGTTDVLILLLALAPFLAAQPAVAGPTIAFSNLTPARGAEVTAGPVELAVDMAGVNIQGVAMLLNTELVPVKIERSGHRARVSTERVLAPGRYVVRVVADDEVLWRSTVTWEFTVLDAPGDKPIPDGFTQVDAKIQIVYPHGGAAVTEANLANVGVFLFTPGTSIPVPFDFDKPVRLWRALNNNPAEPVSIGEKVIRSVGGVTFPAWEFNDVDVSAARDPNNKLFFYVTVDGMGTNSNVWVHGADPRTYFPFQDVPAAVGQWTEEVDSKIEIVYPHDGLPVRQAQRANIGVDIFARGTLQSVDTSRDPFVVLLSSLNANVAGQGAGESGNRFGVRETMTTGGLEHPRWVFNDVDVSPANVPSNLLLFRTMVDGVQTFSNVWAHGSDVRTIFPIQDVPARSAQGAIPAGG